jgi:Phage tail sheath protein subtilisin-like domain/Phage tail sheath C-terminal domain
MAYSLSPGVTWSEVDLTTVVPAASTTEGAFAGHFDWGPIDEVVSVANEIELVSKFGKPSDNSAVSFFTAANFLAYGDNLRVVRSANTLAANNATSGNTAALIKNRDDWDINWDVFGTNNPKYGMFAARYAGTLGNEIKVCLFANAGISSSATEWTNWDQAPRFAAPPGTSEYVANRGGANDELHIVVLDTKGTFTGGVANSVLEIYSNLSKAVDATNDDGSSNYWVNVLADRSAFIWPINHMISNITTPAVQTTTWGSVASGTSFTQGAANVNVILAGGVLAVPSDGELQNSYVKFSDTDAYDTSLIMMGGASNNVSQYVINNIADPVGTYGRGDVVVFVSPQYTDVIDQPGQEVNKSIITRNFFGSSSYAFMDSGWKKQFDKYSNKYRWIPLNGDIAGLCTRTDQTRDAWFSPAGLNRGQIKNVTKLAWQPTKTDRDNLYKNNINPVVTFKGEGTVLYGDKTLQTKPSAFDRINVRRLFIVLEKTISKAAKYSLFEFNDEFTRSQFVALVEPFLRDVKGRRGVYDYKVVCDETNNTQQVIDSNQFVGDIYIKPARSINFIHLNFVAVRTGVAFSEIVGKF